jgi:zinc/manganese transport system substrate-binding protein
MVSTFRLLWIAAGDEAHQMARSAAPPNAPERYPMKVRCTVTVLGTAVVMTTAALLAACGQPPGTPTGTAAAKPEVVTTTDVYGSVAASVAGDKASVHAIISDPATDPHDYEATASDALAVSKAALLVANGAGYDDFAGKLRQTAGGRPALIDVAELSGLPGSSTGQPGSGTSLPPAAPDFNEHVWYDLPTVGKLADRIAAELGRVDPSDAAAFTANAAKFKTGLDGLTTKVAGISAAHRGERVAVTEPVPGYLISAAGLVDVTPPALPHAVEEGNDPPAGALDQTLRLFQGPDRVRALLVNAQTGGATTDQLTMAADTAGVPVVAVTETFPGGTTDYVTWMGDEIDRLAAALDRR